MAQKIFDADADAASSQYALGRIHSIESMGTVDGPGIRFVVFTQGCPMRCAYCHNPDTWAVNAGSMVSVEKLVQEFESNRQFYKSGGITVTGGGPLLSFRICWPICSAPCMRIPAAVCIRALIAAAMLIRPSIRSALTRCCARPIWCCWILSMPTPRVIAS